MGHVLSHMIRSVGKVVLAVLYTVHGPLDVRTAES